jgi:SAM-dependent methyltransferase
MFTRSARIYDAVYYWKNYAGEAEQIHALIQQHKRSPGNALLDVGCGTGAHLSFLRADYVVEGLDFSEEMLAVARQRNPGLVFHQGDMVSFDLGRRFDVVICMFNAVAHVKTVARLGQTLQTFARHVKPGGLVIAEPFFDSETYQRAFPPGKVIANLARQADVQVARMFISRMEDGLAIWEMNYLVGTAEGIEYFVERHELALFSSDEYLAAFQSAGLDARHVPVELIERGLYLGVQPLMEGEHREV